MFVFKLVGLAKASTSPAFSNFEHSLNISEGLTTFDGYETTTFANPVKSRVTVLKYTSLFGENISVQPKG